MTTETKSKTKTPTKILADVYLEVYQGENHIFVKVNAPDEIELEKEEKQKHIRRFYRWANAVLGIAPKDAWDGQLRWARLPDSKVINGKRTYTIGLLHKVFNLHVVSAKAFYRSEE